MIRQKQSLLNITQVCLDVLILVLSLALSWYIRFYSGYFEVKNIPELDFYAKPLIMIIPLYIIIYKLFKLYAPRRTEKFINEFIRIFESNTIALLMIMSFTFALKTSANYSRLLVGIFGMTTILLMSIERLVLKEVLLSIRKKGYNKKYLLIIGASDLGGKFAETIGNYKGYGYEVIGFLDDNRQLGQKVNGFKVTGRINELEKKLHENLVDEVICTLPTREYNLLEQIINTCEKEGVKIKIVPDYYKYVSLGATMEYIDEIPVMNLRSVPLDYTINRVMKRISDIILSLIAIILSSPIMLFVTIGVKLSSPGPILFKQERVGLDNKKFEMYKYRSMRVQAKEEEKTQWTTKNDPRKTKFGSFIRKTSLDELPQFFNVLKGDMSIVGPRPERPYWVNKFKEEIPQYMLRHSVKAGITGWAQVNGWRGDTSIKKRIECDIYYIKNWSLLLDIKILFMTVFNGFVNKNAY